MNSILPLIEGKSLVKSFKKEPIPETLLNSLIDAAAETVSYGNFQPWRVVVVMEEEKRKALAQHVSPLLEQAPAVFVFTTSWRECEQSLPQIQATAQAVEAWTPEMMALVEKRLHQNGFKLQEIMRKDVVIAAAQTALLAENFGLGSRFFYEWEETPLQAIVQAPSDQIIVAILGIGYSAETLKNPGRLPRKQLFFLNDFKTPYQFRPRHLRSPREKALGLVHLPRLIDKIRLAEKNQLPGYNFISIGFDKLLLDLLEIKPEALMEVVKNSSEDEAVYQWVKEKGKSLSEAEKEAFNQRLLSVGPSDAARSVRFRYLLDATDPKRQDVKSFMELIDLMESRI